MLLVNNDNAILMEFAARGKLYPTVSTVALLMAILGSWLLFPADFQGFSGDMNSNINIEKARESTGLFLIAVTQALLLIYVRRREKKL